MSSFISVTILGIINNLEDEFSSHKIRRENSRNREGILAMSVLIGHYTNCQSHIPNLAFHSDKES